MKNKSLIIIILQSTLIIGLLWIIIYLGKDKIFTSDFEEIQENISAESFGIQIISLSDSSIKNSGILINPVIESTHQSLYSSYGYVVNLKNLINYKTKTSNIEYKYAQLNRLFEAETEHFEVLKSLNDDNKNIADSVVHEKKMHIDNLRDDINILKHKKQNLLDIVKHEWGEKFKDLIINPKKSPLKTIFSSEARLLKITITDDQIKNSLPLKLEVFSLNQPEIKYEANFVSEASSIDENIQGKSYYYLTLNSNLMIGSKINSYTNSPKEKAFKTFYIPNSAIIWNKGQAWVYKETTKNSFSRQAIFNMEEVKDGWNVQFKNTPPESIVTSGAQLLLSEEYKHLITNENED